MRSILFLLFGAGVGLLLGAAYRRFSDRRGEQAVEDMAADVAKRLDYLENQIRV
ncbi:MAG: hypothetical protein ACOCX1_04735 [Fimbriimonadaceae bacterium]